MGPYNTDSGNHYINNHGAGGAAKPDILSETQSRRASFNSVHLSKRA